MHSMARRRNGGLSALRSAKNVRMPNSSKYTGCDSTHELISGNPGKLGYKGVELMGIEGKQRGNSKNEPFSSKKAGYLNVKSPEHCNDGYSFQIVA